MAAKERITVYLEPDLLKRLGRLFPGLNRSQAVSKVLELYFDVKDYSDWAVRNAVFSSACMTMLADMAFPDDPGKQDLYMRSHVAKADAYVLRKLKDDGRL